MVRRMLKMPVGVVEVAKNIRMTAATVKPTLEAFKPSSDALTPLYFFNSFQKRYTKKIKNVPGRKIPTLAAPLPIS